MYSIIEDTGNVQSVSDVVLASGDPARTADTWNELRRWVVNMLWMDTP